MGRTQIGDAREITLRRRRYNRRTCVRSQLHAVATYASSAPLHPNGLPLAHLQSAHDALISRQTRAGQGRRIDKETESGMAAVVCAVVIASSAKPPGLLRSP